MESKTYRGVEIAGAAADGIGICNVGFVVAEGDDQVGILVGHDLRAGMEPAATVKLSDLRKAVESLNAAVTIGRSDAAAECPRCQGTRGVQAATPAGQPAEIPCPDCLAEVRP
jgi:hypothetical protein